MPVPAPASFPPCPPARLQLAGASRAERKTILGDLLRTDPLQTPRLSDPTPEAGILEDLLLAAASLGFRCAALDQAGPGSPAPDEALRMGARLTEDGAVEPALAAALYRGEQLSMSHLSDDPVVAGAPDPLARAEAWLTSPARLLARHPEILPSLAQAPLQPALMRWLHETARATPWPYATTALLPAGHPGEAVLPRDRVARDQQAPEALAALLRDPVPQAAPLEDHGARLEVEAIALGRWLAKSLNIDEFHIGASAGWAIAAALLKSPFFGADAELMSARLSAIRRILEIQRLQFNPALAPVLAAASPLSRPGPVLEAALRSLAARPAQGLEADLSRVDFPDAWPSELPIAPPQAARFLLQRSNAPWFDALGAEARAEVLTSLRRGPVEATSWIWPAIFRQHTAYEGGRLSAEEQASLRPVWLEQVQIARAEHLPRLVLGGLALCGGLDEAAQALLLQRALDTSDRWRIGLVNLVAERAPAQREAAALHLLLLLQGADRSLRVPAAVALHRLVRSGVLDRGWLDRIEASLDPVLRRHPDVADERRRLGRAD